MAALILQSRFAGLQIEDDEFSSSGNQKCKKTKPAAKKCEPTKKIKTNNNKCQSATKKKKSKQNGSTAEQWEQWKQKDEELVDGNFETEMQQAILLSKLDFEEKKDVYKQLKKDAQNEKKAEQLRVSNKKLKKKNVMSLDQFNNMLNTGEVKTEDIKSTQEENLVSEEPKLNNKDTEFFERVKHETKSELLKDKIKDRIKQQSVSDEIITRVQFAHALEKKDEEIFALQEEITNLKKELHTVKTRNKKLCNILGQGEMRDKAEVLVEVERLRGVQAELTAELATLHTDLEKERSRNMDSKTKDKKYPNKKKNIRFDVSSEAIMTKDNSSGTA